MFCALYARDRAALGADRCCTSAWNLAQGYLFGAAVSGGGLGGSIAVEHGAPRAHPAWLTGGGFGPEASVFALVLVSAVTVGALALARRRRTKATLGAATSERVPRPRRVRRRRPAHVNPFPPSTPALHAAGETMTSALQPGTPAA